jgi:hypothetical protein
MERKVGDCVVMRNKDPDEYGVIHWKRMKVIGHDDGFTDNQRKKHRAKSGESLPEPSESKPVESQPTKQRAKSQPPKSQSIKSKPTKSKPAESQPAKFDPAKFEPAKSGDPLPEPSKSALNTRSKKRHAASIESTHSMALGHDPIALIASSPPAHKPSLDLPTSPTPPDHKHQPTQPAHHTPNPPPDHNPQLDTPTSPTRKSPTDYKPQSDTPTQPDQPAALALSATPNTSPWEQAQVAIKSIGSSQEMASEYAQKRKPETYQKVVPEPTQPSQPSQPIQHAALALPDQPDALALSATPKTFSWEQGQEVIKSIGSSPEMEFEYAQTRKVESDQQVVLHSTQPAQPSQPLQCDALALPDQPAALGSSQEMAFEHAQPIKAESYQQVVLEGTNMIRSPVDVSMLLEFLWSVDWFEAWRNNYTSYVNSNNSAPVFCDVSASGPLQLMYASGPLQLFYFPDSLNRKFEYRLIGIPAFAETIGWHRACVKCVGYEVSQMLGNALGGAPNMRFKYDKICALDPPGYQAFLARLTPVFTDDLVERLINFVSPRAAFVRAPLPCVERPACDSYLRALVKGSAIVVEGQDGIFRDLIVHEVQSNHTQANPSYVSLEFGGKVMMSEAHRVSLYYSAADANAVRHPKVTLDTNAIRDIHREAVVLPPLVDVSSLVRFIQEAEWFSDWQLRNYVIQPTGSLLDDSSDCILYSSGPLALVYMPLQATFRYTIIGSPECDYNERWTQACIECIGGKLAEHLNDVLSTTLESAYSAESSLRVKYEKIRALALGDKAMYQRFLGRLKPMFTPGLERALKKRSSSDVCLAGKSLKRLCA